jgi:hypothetical protein
MPRMNERTCAFPTCLIMPFVRYLSLIRPFLLCFVLQLRVGQRLTQNAAAAAAAVAMANIDKREQQKK